MLILTLALILILILGYYVLGYGFRIIGFRRGALRGAKPPVPKKRI
jgi:hypothetical protein